MDSSFNSLFSFNLEKDTLFYIHCFISDKQCDHSQLRNLLHFKLLPCKRGRAPPFYLLPWDSMRRNELDGNSNANGCHCWDWKIPWRRKWQCTPVFLLGKSHGLRSLVGYSPCGLRSRTRLHFHFRFIYITSLIPKISYLEGLYCYIPLFYQRGDWDTTWSYGLPKIAEQNLYSNLCLCHGYMHKILVIMCFIKMIRKYTGPLQWQLYLNTDS